MNKKKILKTIDYINSISHFTFLIASGAFYYSISELGSETTKIKNILKKIQPKLEKLK